MKKALKPLFIILILLQSLNANASVLSRIEAVFCQGPNSSIYIDLTKKIVERARFKTEISKIENISLDEKNGLISYTELNSTVVYTLKLMGGIYDDDRVSIDYFIGNTFVFDCQGRVK